MSWALRCEMGKVRCRGMVRLGKGRKIFRINLERNVYGGYGKGNRSWKNRRRNSRRWEGEEMRGYAIWPWVSSLSRGCERWW
jgi:hypothetical protein